jgi:primosomal protein N' (replication factor Y)
MLDAAPPEAPAGRLVEVAVALPIVGTFHYLAPPPLDARLAPGHRVLVPFGRRRVTAYVVGFPQAAGVRAVKPVLALLDDDAPLVPASLLDLLRWVADYYLAPLGEVFRTALPGGLAPASSRRLVLTPAGLAAARALELEPGPSAESRLLTRLAAAGDGLLARPLLAGGGAAARQAIGSLRRRGLVEEAERVGGDRARARREVVVRLAGGLDEPTLARIARLAPKRAAVLRLLRDRGPTPLADLRRVLGEVGAPLRALAAGGLVTLETVDVGRRVDWGLGPAAGDEPPATLTVAQVSALDAATSALATGGFASFLLHGVTGSGKTEVYIRAIQAVLARGRGAVVLVPEISLTPQLVGRFCRRLGDRVAVLHSGLSEGERFDEWRRVRLGAAPVVVGARSAVFAPVEPLGLIVVDEEQEGSFKQDDGVRYHARDVALVRARQAGALCLLGSATPSLESWTRATGRLDSGAQHGYLRLPERVASRPLPPVEIVDLRQGLGGVTGATRGANARKRPAAASEPPAPVSALLEAAIERTLAAGQQALLFLNRRGYATFLLCPDCGYRFGCRDCSVALVFHRAEQALRCHYCGASRPAPALCPKCGGADVLQFGSGTERVEEWLATRFPGARIARLDRDAVGTKGAVRDLLAEVAAGRVDLLVGTQMVAKGHDFPGVTLVGVLLAESGLAFPDFRAAERTFQLLTQVAGRAGRGEVPGRVIIQTYDPEHPAVRLAAGHELETFYEQELAARRELGYPPFRRLVNLRLDAPTAEGARLAATQVAACVAARLAGDPELATQVEMVGPAPAPLSRLRGRHRWQLLLKGRTSGAVRRLAGAVAAEATGRRALPAGATLSLDVDPASLL